MLERDPGHDFAVLPGAAGTAAAALALALAAAAVRAQEESPAVPARPRAVAAVERYAGAATPDEVLRETAAEAVLDAGSPAFAALAAMLRAAEPGERGADSGEPVRFRRLGEVLERVAAGFLRRAVESEMIYAGQYSDLAVLQPFVGDVLLRLLLAPPDWFPEDDRPLVVPALRDLFPRAPSDAVLEQTRRIAEDEDFETRRLRYSLTCLLAQWGDSDLVDRRVRALEERAAEGSPVDRVLALREIANIRYRLRDYAAAAAVYRRLLRKGEAIEHPLAPADYYNAACSMSLCGDLQSALDELERCVALMSSGTVDESLMLERKLFEKDPDLRAIRKTDRFASILATAFGERKDRDGG